MVRTSAMFTVTASAGSCPRVHQDHLDSVCRISFRMIRKLKSGEFRVYSRKKNASTGKRKNLGTFSTLEQAKQHEREVQYFKRH